MGDGERNGRAIWDTPSEVVNINGSAAKRVVNHADLWTAMAATAKSLYQLQNTCPKISQLQGDTHAQITTSNTEKKNSPNTPQ